jgi:transformation/transcription domain-associated protein
MAPSKAALQPYELVEELMSTLKTNFPLLALTMEKMVDQISLRAKPSSDEDIYRFFAALLADALQVSIRTHYGRD